MKEFSLGIIQEEKDKFRRKSWAGHVISMVVNLYLNKLIFKH
jgi:hypothetical protein